MCPAAVEAVAVTLTTTADTPLAGTPPLPVTCTATAVCGWIAALGAPTPLRVSSTRDGPTAANAPAADGLADARPPAPELLEWLAGAADAVPTGLRRVNASNVKLLSKAGQSTRILRRTDIIPPGIPLLRHPQIRASCHSAEKCLSESARTALPTSKTALCRLTRVNPRGGLRVICAQRGRTPVQGSSSCSDAAPASADAMPSGTASCAQATPHRR